MSDDTGFDEQSVKDDETPSDEKPRQWIYDRLNGESKDGDTHPPCPLCRPPVCLKLCPDFFEQNVCCESVGKFGIVEDDDESGESKRTILMGIGLGSNIIGLIFTIVACFGISEVFGIIETVPYTQVTAINDNFPIFENMTISVGLVAMAIRNPPNGSVSEVVLKADEYCEVSGLRFRSIIAYEDCQQCAKVSVGLVSTVLLSCISYIPSISTNILRMYPHYDVNCQKGLGIFSTSFSLVMSALTWRGYTGACLNSFTVGRVAFNRFGNPVALDSPAAFVHYYLHPHHGVGFIMIAFATLLKAIDILAHLALPTPPITRSRQLQLEYEKRQ